MAQSSVEWLVERIKKDPDLRLRGFDIDGIAEQAKAMHKREIIKAWYERALLTKENHYQINSNTAHQYYNETFNNETE